MADNSVKFRGGNATPPAGTSGTSGATGTSSAPAEVKSIADIFALAQSPSTLSKEGEAYIEKIVDTLNASGREAKQHKIVGANYEARVIECNDTYQAFVMAETYQGTADPSPIAACRSDFQNVMLAAQLDPAKLDQFLIVTKEDYAKADVAASYITNSYMASDNPIVRDLSAASFANGMFRITTDISLVRSFVEKTYPFQTLPRMDVGMLLYVTKPIENAFDRNGRQEVQRYPILAVTGYTDFEYSNNGMYGQQVTKYTPIFVCTGIHSRLVCDKIAVTGMALASSIFIRQNHWLEQFSSFQKGAPDIGHLVMDEKNKLLHAANVNDRNRVIGMALSTPMPLMALDIQLGAPIMSGFSNIIKDAAKFNLAVDKFTGGQGAQRVQQPIQVRTFRFDGRVVINKSGLADFVDTRTVDYLHLVQSGMLPGDAADMLQPTLEPKVKCDVLKRTYNDAQLLYITHRVILNPEYVDAIANDLAQTLKVQVEGMYAQNTYDVAQLAGFQPNVGNAFMATTSYSPYSGHYFF